MACIDDINLTEGYYAIKDHYVLVTGEIKFRGMFNNVDVGFDDEVHHASPC